MLTSSVPPNRRSNSLLTEIYKARTVVGNARQPQFQMQFASLRKAMRGMPHPYRLRDYSALYRCPEFAPGAQGTSGSATGCDFLFRLSSLKNVVRHVTNWHLGTRRSEERLFFHLANDFDLNGKQWLPLSAYADGKLSGIREFTWWTSNALDPDNIVCASHSLGLPNSWIPKLALLLRVRSATVQVRVPSILDAFCSEVFVPADYRSTGTIPSCGQTIDLDSEPLNAGSNEFVLRPISVELLEFKPIRIDASLRLRHVVRVDSKLLRQLYTYYILKLR